MRPFIVYDPVMTASSGDALSGAGFVEAVRRELLPIVDCLTPNLAEAARCSASRSPGREADMERQGEALLELGPRAALMKGGHLNGDEAVDLISAEGVHRFAAPRVASRNLHGTGCTLSSAVAANWILGMALPEAVGAAKAVRPRGDRKGARDQRSGGEPGPVIQVEAVLRDDDFRRRFRACARMAASREEEQPASDDREFYDDPQFR